MIIPIYCSLQIIGLNALENKFYWSPTFRFSKSLLKAITRHFNNELTNSAKIKNQNKIIALVWCKSQNRYIPQKKMRIISWNVNGIRAVAQKNFFNDLEKMAPDIICIQETKAQDNQVAETLDSLKDFYIFSNSAEKKGYSGTAILSKIKPLNYKTDIGIDLHDYEGRVLCLEYDAFFLVNVYVPNSGSDLKRLGYRQLWDLDFLDYLKNLKEIKPVVVCGDFNVAHQPIDLTHPKANYNKYAGYMQVEIDGMDRYMQNGLIDSFRHFYPEMKGAYSWWSYRAGAREKNVGWRIDYFLVSEPLIFRVKTAFILNEIMGSDHCPVGIELSI